MPDTLYEADFFLWTQEQARLLRECARAGTNLPLDWEHLAEEIESVGRRDHRELQSRVTVVLEHLLKLQFSRASTPRRQWVTTVRTQRRRIERLLQDNPSLKSFIPVIVRDELSWIAEETALALQDAGELAEDAYRPMTAAFYTEDELLGDWLPEPPAA